jgi:hypothetical protein
MLSTQPNPLLSVAEIGVLNCSGCGKPMRLARIEPDKRERNTTLDQNHWLTRQSAACITDTADTLGLDWLSPRKRYGANALWRGQFLRELGGGLIVLTYSQNRPCTGPQHPSVNTWPGAEPVALGRHEPGRCAVGRAPATSVTSTRRMH